MNEITLEQAQLWYLPRFVKWVGWYIVTAKSNWSATVMKLSQSAR